MDETEVQVEIACWAQDHADASMISWDNGNEPWVDFSGQRCTLHLGLGGLTWNIEVPIGYQTEIDPGDGKRKRLWEPLDYHDTVILQSRNTPFHVSVVDRANNILELCNGLGQEVVIKAVTGPPIDEVEQQQKVHDLLKSLQVESAPQSQPDTARVRHEGGRALRVTSNAYIEAMKGAETLAQVLDGIHGLAKLYNSHTQSSTDPDRDAAEGAFCEDEDDEHLFDGDLTMKWSFIAAQVNYAREACAYAVGRSLTVRDWAASAVDSGNVSKEDVLGVKVSFPSCSPGPSESVFQPENFTLASPPGSQSRPSASSDTDDEYTFLLPGPVPVPTDLREDSKPQPNDDGATFGLSDFHLDDAFRYDSDSDKSDSSWEMPGFRNRKSSSNGAAESQPEVAWPWNPVRKMARAKCPQGSDDGLPSTRPEVVEQSSRNLEVLDILQWCDIKFNPLSFSAECTLHLSQFMNNLTVATALGFALEHPLRVEIVPNKSHVDSLSWTGAVEVYVSQHNDWHNHISEEICGLLCLVPAIVQKYFRDEVPILIRNHSELGTLDSRRDLFVGLLQTLVRRLVNVNAGGSCCICGKHGDSPKAFHMQGRSVWPCNDSFCLATYATWQEVSSSDSQEREREDVSRLRLMEESLRETFSYADRDALNSALEVYGVNPDNMNYGQGIRALARIEMWNQKDPDTSTLSYPVFETDEE